MNLFPPKPVETKHRYHCDDCEQASTFYILAEEYHVLKHEVVFLLWCSNCYEEKGENCTFYRNTKPFGYWVSLRGTATNGDKN